jgi:hypothetical protein
MANVLRNFVRKILLEGQFENRVEQVKGSKKFEQHDKLVDQLVQGLTYANLKNVGYLNWGLKQIQQARVVELGTIAREIVSVLIQFDKLKGGLPKKDIMQWKTLGELRGAIEERIAAREKAQDKRRHRGDKMRLVALESDENLAKAIGESDILMGGNTPDELAASQLIVVHPHTKFASQYWGNPTEFACNSSIAQGSTRWCTAATRTENYFNRYAGGNVHLYYIIDKRRKPNDVYYKIAYAVNETDYGTDIESFDAEDEEIDESNIKLALGADYKRVRDAIFSHYEASPGTKVVFLKYEARNPETSPERLADLANFDSDDIKLNVARNPSTPPGVIVKLANDPSPDIQEYFVMNINDEDMPDNAKIALAKNGNKSIREIIAKEARGDGVPPEVYEILSSITPRNYDDQNFAIILNLAKNHYVPSWVLEKVYDKNQKFRMVKVRLANNYNTPLHVLKKLLSDAKNTSDSGIGMSIADHHKVTSDMLRELHELEEYEVDKTIAGNEKTPLDILVKLAEDEDFGVREAIAGNHKTPTHALVKLGKDQDHVVRQAVAGNKNTPIPVLIQLAGDNKTQVRRAIVDNPSVPIEALKIIAGSGHRYDSIPAQAKLRRMGLEING